MVYYCNCEQSCYLLNLLRFAASFVQAGIDTMTTYAALALAIYLFQTQLINSNWRNTQYFSTFFASVLGLLWIPAYYNVGGTQNPWYTIFIDLDQVTRKFNILTRRQLIIIIV